MDTLKLAVTVLVRYLIVGACAWLIKKGVLSQGDAATFQNPTVIGAIAVGTVTILAAIYSRLRSRFKTNVALNLPAGSTSNDVKNVVADSTVAQVISTKAP